MTRAISVRGPTAVEGSVWRKRPELASLLSRVGEFGGVHVGGVLAPSFLEALTREVKLLRLKRAPMLVGPVRQEVELFRLDVSEGLEGARYPELARHLDALVELIASAAKGRGLPDGGMIITNTPARDERGNPEPAPHLTPRCTRHRECGNRRSASEYRSR